MADPASNESLDALLRRSLSAEQRAERERELGATAAEDLALARVLAGLPDKPIASNFNARVLGALDGPDSAPPAVPWWARVRLPRWTIAGTAAALLAALALVGWQQHTRRLQAGTFRPIAALGALEQLSPAVLQDFDAIQRYAGGPAAGVDFELLESLQ